MKLRLAALAALTLVLTACGGGSSQVDPFEPTQLVAFGDEASLLTADGRRYAVNGLKTVNEQSVLDCGANPIWVQTLANLYGLVLAECNPDAKPVTARLRGTLGAKVADVRTQIDQHLASGGNLGSRTLTTVLAGTHDIVELYQQFPTQTEVQLRAAAAARGRQLADQVNRIANANGRVLVLTLPNVGLTPYARTEKANNTDVNRQALITALTEEFNRALRLQLINDGRLIGLVLADERVDLLGNFPSSFGLTEITKPACATALPNCTTATLVTDATSTTWMWADTLRYGQIVQTEIGNLAATRLSALPF